MKIARGSLLGRLNEAAIGLSSKEILEQSSCFVFTGDQLITFNDSIMVRVANPLQEICGTDDDPVDIVVASADLLQLLARIPDDEVTITAVSGELKVKGSGRRAGITCQHEVALPVTEVPQPGKWHRLGEGVTGLLQQAARTCGSNEEAFLATCVHITSERVEACDNYRLFRADVATGFPQEVLIPAGSVEKLEKLEITKVSVVGDSAWCHFKTAGGAVVSVRCSFEKYRDVEAILTVRKGEKVVLPTNLGEIMQRAEVFHTGGYDAKVGVRVADGELTVTSRKEGGWYKERKAIDYKGRDLAFDINPKFLVEILARTREVVVDDRKIKITTGPIQFVAGLQMAAAPAAAEDEPRETVPTPEGTTKEYSMPPSDPIDKAVDALLEQSLGSLSQFIRSQMVKRIAEKVAASPEWKAAMREMLYGTGTGCPNGIIMSPAKRRRNAEKYNDHFLGAVAEWSGKKARRRQRRERYRCDKKRSKK